MNVDPDCCGCLSTVLLLITRSMVRMMARHFNTVRRPLFPITKEFEFEKTRCHMSILTPRIPGAIRAADQTNADVKFAN